MIGSVDVDEIVPVNNIHKSRTALGFAAENGHLSIVDLLIDAKANVNYANEFDITALILAAENGQVEVVNRLIQSKVDVNHFDVSGYTALLSAALSTSARPERVVQVVCSLIKARANVDHANKHGDTALMFASEIGNVGIVNELIKAKAEVNKADIHSKRTALMVASATGHHGVVALLLRANANIEKRGKYCTSALKYAVSSGHKLVVDILVKHGAETWEFYDNELVQSAIIKSEKVQFLELTQFVQSMPYNSIGSLVVVVEDVIKTMITEPKRRRAAS